MAILSNEREAIKGNASSNNEGLLIRQYSEKRLVICDQAYTIYQLGTLLGSSYGYVVGVPFSEDPYAFLEDFDIDRKKTRGAKVAYDVSLKWSTLANPTYNNSTDPTQQRIKRRWTTQEHTFHIIKDINGNLIVNTADQPFEGGIPVVMELPMLEYRWNTPSFNGAYATAVSNAINSTPFSGADTETLRCKLTAEEVYQGPYHYWSTTAEMKYFPLGWQPKPLNAGLLQIKGSQLVPCLDAHKQPVSHPVPLDLSGLQIALASLPAAANYITVEWFSAIDFNSLGLPPI